MIKQDYLLRMIQEIISMIVETLLYKKKIRKKDWDEYDHLTRQILDMDTRQLLNTSAEELIARHASTPDGLNKLELAAVNMLKLAEDVEDNNLLLKSKLRQESVSLVHTATQHQLLPATRLPHQSARNKPITIPFIHFPPPNLLKDMLNR